MGYDVRLCFFTTHKPFAIQVPPEVVPLAAAVRGEEDV